MTPTGLFSGIVIGLLIGALARLVVRNSQPLGCLLTLIIGVVGGTIGAAIAGWILTLTQFVPNVTQSATAITGIKLLVSVIPGILYMSCAIFMIFYKIDSKTTDLMKKELDVRRAKL